MMTHKFTRNSYDWYVYHKELNTGNVMYLLLYVDDMLIACQDLEEIKSLKAELSVEFEMKDLGQAKMIIGMEIQRNMHKSCFCLSKVMPKRCLKYLKWTMKNLLQDL